MVWARSRAFRILKAKIDDAPVLGAVLAFLSLAIIDLIFGTSLAMVFTLFAVDVSQPRTIARPSSTQIPPALVVEACPVISYYGQVIRNAADVASAGRYLRASLGAHPSTWDEAVRTIGDLSAAAAVIYVLQLYDDDVASGRNRIRNAGGYYRSIVRLIGSGAINLQSELLALRRRKLV